MSVFGLTLSLVAIALAVLLLTDRQPSPVALVTARRRRIERVAVVAGLPDALRRLAAELSAGRTLEHALASVGGAATAPVGPALSEAARDLTAGRAVEVALERALPDDGSCRLLAAALAVQRRTGGDLPRLLRTLAGALDERMRVEAEVRALTAQARFSALVVPLLPPLGLLAMLVVAPHGVMLLATTSPGLALVGLAAILNTAGALTIRRLAAAVR